MAKLSNLVLGLALVSSLYDFGKAIDVYYALAKNKGYFDFGFTTTFTGVTPHVLENYLFIGQKYWTVIRDQNDDKIVCFPERESRENKNFEAKFYVAFSYLSDHLIKQLNTRTNHVLLLFRLAYPQYFQNTNHQVIEVIFSANQSNLGKYVGGDYYMYSMVDFNSSVAYRPISFEKSSLTNSSHFVFIEQKPTDDGFKRKTEIHSLVIVSFRNSTEELKEYIPPFIKSIDPQIYINAIFATNIGKNYDTSGAILILNHKGLIKYCITDERSLDQSCEPSNLKELSQCSRKTSHDEEL